MSTRFSFLFEIWNFIEFVNLCVFLIVFALQWAWWKQSEDVQAKLPFNNRYPGELENVLYLYLLQVYCNSLNTVLSFLKLLKFLRMNDLLNVLSRTMANCQKNIIGVLVLFLFVVMGYSITANTLFGAGLWSFKDISTSFSSLLRMLMGDFDYPGMRQENRYLSGVFFWSFEILGLFILLNFITAFIADGFDKATENQPKDLLKQQIDDMWKRFRRVRVNQATVVSDVFTFVRKFLFNSDTLYYKQLHHYIQQRIITEAQNSGNEQEVSTKHKTIQKMDLEVALYASFTSTPPLNLWLDHLWTEMINECNEHLTDTTENEKELLEYAENGVEAAMKDALEGIEELSSALETIQHRLVHTINLSLATHSIQSADRTPQTISR
jgi:hypothetical protein